MPGRPKNLVFKFEVDDAGKFYFDPPGDWGYSHVDRIRFESRSGEFTVTLIPLIAAGLPHDPIGSPVQGKLDPQQQKEGCWSVTAEVNDGLSPEERKVLIQANTRPGTLGFVATYRYDIEVRKPNGKVERSNQHNGVHGC